MFKSKESGNEIVWRVRLMDKVGTLGIEVDFDSHGLLV